MKKMLSIALALAAASVLADAATDFVKARRRLINREIVGDMAVYTYAQGTRTWKETNAIERVAVRTAPARYSKLKLIRAAKNAGKWEELKAAIAAMGMEDEWQACQHIQSDDAAYVAATNAIVVRGIATEADVKAFMKFAED
jgi:hypothetical protein